MLPASFLFFFFFFNDTATTEIYTLSLHDALPISAIVGALPAGGRLVRADRFPLADHALACAWHAGSQKRLRSEEHTSELQSRLHLVCRLLLEKKKKRHSIARRYNNVTPADCPSVR